MGRGKRSGWELLTQAKASGLVGVSMHVSVSIDGKDCAWSWGGREMRLSTMDHRKVTEVLAKQFWMPLMNIGGCSAMNEFLIAQVNWPTIATQAMRIDSCVTFQTANMAMSFSLGSIVTMGLMRRYTWVPVEI